MNWRGLHEVLQIRYFSEKSVVYIAHLWNDFELTDECECSRFRLPGSSGTLSQAFS
jgi:hypothetical protein